jgi:hypothetical protein
MTTKLEQERLECLPYGQWRTKDHQLVLFDRQYRPIFSENRKGDITMMHGDEWIDGIVEDQTEYFYDDSKTSEMDFYTLAKIKKLMAEWTMRWRQQSTSTLQKPKAKAKMKEDKQ